MKAIHQILLESLLGNAYARKSSKLDEGRKEIHVCARAPPAQRALQRNSNYPTTVEQRRRQIQNQKNYNSGGEIADETIADSRTVTVTLFHDAKRRSALYVPVALQETLGTTR
jgi:hypothetical protein